MTTMPTIVKASIENHKTMVLNAKLIGTCTSNFMYALGYLSALYEAEIINDTQYLDASLELTDSFTEAKLRLEPKIEILTAYVEA